MKIILNQYLILFLCFCSMARAQNADITLLRHFHADSSLHKDRFCRGLSFSVAPLAIASPFSMVLTGFLRKDEDMKRNGYKSAAGILLTATLGASLKFAIRRDRPFKTYNFIHAKDKVGPYSFPSNHTALAFATATTLSLSYPKWYVIAPAYLWASGVSYSRMYLGVHYPSDILGGMVIGIGSSFLVWKVDKWMNNR